MTALNTTSVAPFPEKLSARIEPFDTYWQGNRNLATGYGQFETYYKANYLGRLPADRAVRIAVLSCGPGYLVYALKNAGYTNIIGIDANPDFVQHGIERGLPCEVGSPGPFLRDHPGTFDVILPEQELNHLTIEETIPFLQLCRESLRPGGMILCYAINGANPLTGPEHIAHNIDHFYNVTDYSLRQIMTLGGFPNCDVFSCKLYVFWNRPENYVGFVVTKSFEVMLRVVFRLYGKKVHNLSKRIAAVGRA